MELSGLALKTTCHLVYTQGGRASLCVRLHGASNITQRPFGTPALVPFPSAWKSLHPLNSPKMEVRQTRMKLEVKC